MCLEHLEVCICRQMVGRIFFRMRNSVPLTFKAKGEKVRPTRASASGARSFKYSLGFCSDAHVILIDIISFH